MELEFPRNMHINYFVSIIVKSFFLIFTYYQTIWIPLSGLGILVLINLKFWLVLNTVYWNNLPTPLKPLNNMYIYTLCPKHLHLQSWPKFCTAVIEKFRWYSVHYYIQYTVYGQTFRVQRGQIPPPQKKNYIKKQHF